MKIFQSGRRYSPGNHFTEITQRERWNRSMLPTVRGCSAAARSYIRVQMDTNRHIISELQWVHEKEKLQQRVFMFPFIREDA